MANLVHGNRVIDLDLVAAADEVPTLCQELQLCFKVDVGKNMQGRYGPSFGVHR